MSTIPDSSDPIAEQDDLRHEYDFDYRKAKPNRFASRFAGNHRTVVLDPDVAAVFTTTESVNDMLHAIIENMAKAQDSSAQ